MRAADGSADVGLNGCEVGAGLLCALDAERGADGFVVGGAALDLFDQRAEPDFGTGGDCGWIASSIRACAAR